MMDTIDKIATVHFFGRYLPTEAAVAIPEYQSLSKIDKYEENEILALFPLFLQGFSKGSTRSAGGT